MGDPDITGRVIDPRLLLIDWANEQDGWIRRLVGLVLSARRPISETQAVELYDMYLAEKGLQGDVLPEEPRLPYPAGGAESAERLLLIKLSHVDGVNDGLGWTRITRPQPGARAACLCITAHMHLMHPARPLRDLDARAEAAIRALEEGAASVTIIDDLHRVDRAGSGPSPAPPP